MPWYLWSSKNPEHWERAPPPLSTHQAPENRQGQGRQAPWGHRAHSRAVCDTVCPALPHATATVQTSARPLSCPLRGSSKPAPFSGVLPFAPQTRPSTFSVSGAGGAGEQVRGWPQPPRARGQQERPMQFAELHQSQSSDWTRNSRPPSRRLP